MDYLIIIEKTSTGFSAYAPDLPGCIATAQTVIGVRSRMREAIEFHIEGLQLEGLPIPAPTSKAFFFVPRTKGKCEKRTTCRNAIRYKDLREESGYIAIDSQSIRTSI